jgi:Domain of unknown function (DUF4190)
MASPVPTESQQSDAAMSGNRLAIVSFVLAVAALLPALCGFVLLEYVSALPSSLVAVAAVVTVVLYAGGLLASIAAIVTGTVALVRAKRYLPQQRRRGRAIAGLVLGIVVTGLLIFPGGFLFLLGYSCAFNQMCI